MKTYKRTENQSKILASMDKVYEKLIAFKKMKKSKLVVLQEGKIVKIEP